LCLDGVTTNSVDLSWAGNGQQNGFAVQFRDSLNTGAWRYPLPIDDWPVAGTNWTENSDMFSQRYYRIQAVERGGLRANALVNSWSVFEISLLYASSGISGVPENAVSMQKIEYETFDHRNQSSMASGSLFYPEGVASAPLLSWQHGTVCLDADAPSFGNSFDVAAGVYFASQGYAVVMPDYLGLGDVSPGRHPYVHARSQALSAVDMIRAGRTYIDTQPLVLDGRLFLAGYSQGGQATMALHRELEMFHSIEWPVTASAPMAGPYDLSDTMFNRILANTSYESPSYLAYLLLGYNEIYSLFDDPSEVFAMPYDSIIPPMFDGTNTCGEIDAQLPSVPRDMLQPAFLSAVTNDVNHPFRAVLRVNDLYDWSPQSPVRLYHCAADSVVPMVNSVLARDAFLANGVVDAALVDPSPSADHGDCAIPSVIAARIWFDSL